MRIGYAKGELEGDWAVFAKIAGPFVNKVPLDDREDFLHVLLLEMVKVMAKYEVTGKPLTEAGLMRVASYELKGYYDRRRYRLFGLNCTHCTSEQRRECHTMRESSDCPKRKAYRLLSLNKLMEGGDGHNSTELQDLIADDKAIDLDDRLDAKRTLQGLPKRLVQIGYKVYAGIPLQTKEKEYLKHWQKVHPAPIVAGIYHLGERILELLSKKPQGMTRRDLAMRLQVPVREVNWHLGQLIRRQQVISVKRENTRGRSRSPLFLIAGAEIPQEKMVKTERDERIRHAYFAERKSIKQIAREFHHDRRTVRRAIKAVEPATFD